MINLKFILFFLKLEDGVRESVSGLYSQIYELWNRRFRLETALAEQLITFNRDESRGPKDTHLQEITPELAAQIIAQSQVTSKEAAISDASGIHIGHI